MRTSICEAEADSKAGRPASGVLAHLQSHDRRQSSPVYSPPVRVIQYTYTTQAFPRHCSAVC